MSLPSTAFAPTTAPDALAVVVPGPRPANLRVLICGEVNAGKSTLLNALLRKRVLPDNIGRSIRPLVIARPGAEQALEVLSPDGMRRDSAEGADGLRDAAQITLDTPQPHLAGLEFIEVPLVTAEEVSEADLQLMASADVLIWVTIASQAWRLTEKALLQRFGKTLPARRMLVLSRADKLRSASDRSRLMSRVEKETLAEFSAWKMLDGAGSTLDASATCAAQWDRCGAPAILEQLRDWAAEDGQHPATPDTAAVGDAAAPEALTDAPETLIAFPRPQISRGQITNPGVAVDAEEEAAQAAPVVEIDPPHDSAAEVPTGETDPQPAPQPEADDTPHDTIVQEADKPAPAEPILAADADALESAPALPEDWLSTLGPFRTRVPDSAVIGLFHATVATPEASHAIAGTEARLREISDALRGPLAQMRAACTRLDTETAEQPDTPLGLVLSGHEVRMSCHWLPGGWILVLYAPSNAMNPGLQKSLMDQMCADLAGHHA